MTFPTPRLIAGLSEIASQFPAALCDVWGVVHDGISPHRAGVEALIAFRRRGGVVLLISNAPRPASSVWEQLDRIGVDRAAADGLITSGDLARTFLAERGRVRVFHVGPDRDLSLYQGLPLELSDFDSADLVCCSGPFHEETETAEDYDPMLAEMAKRRLLFVCANPDIVVESGNRLVTCAGAIAARYAAIGGETVILGKPLRPVYDAALREIDRLAGRPLALGEVLAIGDGALTDMRGANSVGLPTLFIASGVHAKEYEADCADGAAIGAFLARAGTRASYFMPRLAW